MNQGIAIIGGGPAGISAAIQLKRFDFNPCIFEMNRLGGLLWNARLVENYPGFFRGISGPLLAKYMKRHLEEYKVPLKKEKVDRIVYDSKMDGFTVITSESSYPAGIVVIASGTIAYKGDLLKQVPKDLHKYIFFEIAPILKKRKKKILIIGAGDIAFDYALNLSAANDVTLLHRSREFNALPLLVRWATDTSGLHIYGPAEVETVKKGKDRALSVCISSNDKGAVIPTVSHEFDYIVGAMGRVPQMEFLEENLLDYQDALIASNRLFFAGDVGNGKLRQAVIAAGNGIEVAMKIYMQQKEQL